MCKLKKRWGCIEVKIEIRLDAVILAVWLKFFYAEKRIKFGERIINIRIYK